METSISISVKMAERKNRDRYEDSFDPLIRLIHQDFTMRFQDEIFPQHLQKSLNDLRLSGMSCDVTILVSDKEFSAHKSVLSAASPYFRTMFNTEGTFRESKEDKITLHAVDSDAIAAILEFIYTSNVEITEKNVYPLMESSNLLQIHALRAWINHYLQNTITTDNCLSLYVIANLHEYHDLASSTLRYILLNFSQVAEGDEFLQIPLHVLTKIISSKLLNVVDENSLLKSVLRWVKTDIQNRKDHIEELINKIQLSNVPVQTLIELKNDPIFKSILQNKIEIFINEQLAKKYDTKPENYHVNTEKWETVRYGAEQGVILAIGGESSGVASRSVECFTLGYDSWKYAIPQYVQSNSGPQNMTVIPAMRCARYNAAVANDSYNVYVIGGRNSSNYLDECETYDVKKNRWKSLNNIPCKQEGSGAVIFEGRLVNIGGWNVWGPTREAMEWDEKNKTWRKFPSLTSPRSFHGTLAVAGYIFVLGGYDLDRETALRTGERYDPNLNKWCEIRCMHEARAKFGCAVVDNYIYVIGGINGSLGLKSVERYNFETNEWSYMSPMSVPRHSFSVAVSEKKIYCIGGSDTIHYLNSVEKFNPHTNRWHYVLSMQVSRVGLVSATLSVPLIKPNIPS